MVRSKYFFSIACLLLLFSCGRSVRVSKGDQFEVLEDLREVATVQMDRKHSDGFTCIIPKGSIITVVTTPAATVSFFDIEPTQVSGLTDRKAIEERLVPPHLRNREEYETFFISVPLSYLGTKLKKL